jgi:hypothetical protein
MFTLWFFFHVAIIRCREVVNRDGLTTVLCTLDLFFFAVTSSLAVAVGQPKVARVFDLGKFVLTNVVKSTLYSEVGYIDSHSLSRRWLHRFTFPFETSLPN